MPAVTVKKVSGAVVATSLPVVRVTVRLPIAASGLMVMETPAVVGLVTVTVLTVMPAPKSAVVVPFTKFVNSPVTATLSVLPCWPDAGSTCATRGVPAMTVNPFRSVAFSPSVVSVTVRSPGVAKFWSDTLTIAEVGLVTVTRLTTMPLPKDAVVRFWLKCVF